MIAPIRHGHRADPAQRLERGLEQGVPAFGQGAGGGVQCTDSPLGVGQLVPGRGLDRAGQPLVLAFVAQIGQHGVVEVGPAAAITLTR